MIEFVPCAMQPSVTYIYRGNVPVGFIQGHRYTAAFGCEYTSDELKRISERLDGKPVAEPQPGVVDRVIEFLTQEGRP